MRRFFQRVDLRLRGAMVRFLRTHPRYWAGGPRQRVGSYANCVRLQELGLTGLQIKRGLRMLECEGVFDAIHTVIERWCRRHRWRWQVAFHGRAGGYLVLHRVGIGRRTSCGHGVDDSEDFEKWDIERIRRRVRLVQDFDRLCDEVVRTLVAFCDDYEVIDTDILAPRVGRS